MSEILHQFIFPKDILRFTGFLFNISAESLQISSIIPDHLSFPYTDSAAAPWRKQRGCLDARLSALVGWSDASYANSEQWEIEGYTPPKINTCPPERGPFRKKSSLPTINFQVIRYLFGEYFEGHSEWWIIFKLHWQLLVTITNKHFAQVVLGRWMKNHSRKETIEMDHQPQTHPGLKKKVEISVDHPKQIGALPFNSRNTLYFI